jgi:L-rhamnose mutarotase
MKRLAFKMYLNKGAEEEYKKRHDAICPELVALLKEAGIEDYSIFLDEETSILFGVIKTSNPETLTKLPLNDVMQKWWAYMKDIMQTNADNSPVNIPLKEVFHMN